MGYVARWQNKEKGTWRVVFEDYTPKRRSKTVPKEEYARLGLSPHMTLKEAQAITMRLNADKKIERDEARRQKIARRLREKDEVCHRLFPKPTVQDFEARILNQEPDPKRIKTIWRAAKKAIIAVDIAPRDWLRERASFYNHFKSLKISPDYCKKIIRVMNLWGDFYSSRLGFEFLPLKVPRGHNLARIRERYKGARTRDKASDGLTLDDLKLLRKELNASQYNWMFISLWFGLRPTEVDNLKKGADFWELSADPELRKPVLRVRQTKLSNLSEDEQWKDIPVIATEQKKALDMIRSGAFSRPLPKTIKRITKKNHHLYAGRKGFAILMWSRNRDVVEVSTWLGHKNIDRTYRDYMSWKRTKVRDEILMTG